MDRSQQKHDQDRARIRVQLRVQIVHDHVGQNRQSGNCQLNHGFVEGRDPPDLPVAQHDPGEAQSRRQPQGDADGISSPRFRDARHQYDAGHSRQDAGELFGVQLFPEQKRRGQDHQHGSHIIAQTGGGHRGLHIGGEEKDPVEAEEDPGQDQPEEILTDGGAVRLPPADCHPAEDEQGAHHAPAQSRDLAGQIHEPQERADGAVEQDRRDIIDPFRSHGNAVLHVPLPIFTKSFHSVLYQRGGTLSMAENRCVRFLPFCHGCIRIPFRIERKIRRGT